MENQSSFTSDQNRSLSIVLPPVTQGQPMRSYQDMMAAHGPDSHQDAPHKYTDAGIGTESGPAERGRRSSAFIISANSVASPLGEDFSAIGNSTLASHLDRYRKRRLMSDDCDEAFLAGARKIVQFLHCLWVEQEMCDLVLIADGGEILAHQAVVAAFSPTVSVLLRQKQKGSMQQVAQIDLSDYPRETVCSIVNFLYTTDIELCSRNIAPIVACARQMDIPVIVCICQDYIMDNCDPNNIILYYSIAANNSLSEIQDRLMKVICLAFSEIFRTKHFVYLPLYRLISILTSESLCCSEINVFLAIARWIDHDRNERIQFAKPLLSLVRYHLIDPDQLSTQVQPVEWIFVDRESREAVLDAYK